MNLNEVMLVRLDSANSFRQVARIRVLQSPNSIILHKSNTSVANMLQRRFLLC